MQWVLIAWFVCSTMQLCCKTVCFLYWFIKHCCWVNDTIWHFLVERSWKFDSRSRHWVPWWDYVVLLSTSKELLRKCRPRSPQCPNLSFSCPSGLLCRLKEVNCTSMCVYSLYEIWMNVLHGDYVHSSACFISRIVHLNLIKLSAGGGWDLH
jgi:hypothetical protein